MYSSPSSDSESSSESKKQSRLYLVLTVSISSSHCLWSFNWFGYWFRNIKCFLNWTSGVSGSSGPEGTAFGASVPGGCGCCCHCFWWSPSQSSSMFCRVGQFGPHPQFSAIGLVGWLFFRFEFYLYGGC